MNKLKICLFALLLISNQIKAQYTTYGKKIVKKLCSSSFDGRGYVGNGQRKASKLIIKELKKWDVNPYNKQFEQYFSFAVNTFPSKMEVKIDGKALDPGIDYIVDPSCPSIEGSFKIFEPDSLLLNKPDSMIKLFPEQKKNEFMLLDPKKVDKKIWDKLSRKLYIQNPLHHAGFIELIDREPMFSVASAVSPTPILNIKRQNTSLNNKQIDVKIENQLINPFVTQNIIGYIKGESDSILVLSAHYDHLGRMGKKTYYPGANDNASGVAMVLSLAKYFADHKITPHYTIAFVFFAGEEAGLLGSSYFKDHPIFPLSKIKMMLNLDLEGSGDKGLTIVNGLKNKEGKLMLEINSKKNYFNDIKLNANRPNSDHYPLSMAGVNAFYVFARGEYSFYHSPKDKSDAIPMNGFENIHRLILDLIEKE